MFTSVKFVVGAVVVVAGMVSAAPNPTEPSSTSVFNVGATCSIKWDADSTATWKAMSIQLMSGDNFNMIPITTVAQDIDATDATNNSFTYPCPEVTPTSAIYFYQFSSATDPKNLLWTTRFTIADANGGTTPPTESTQPDGKAIPWGKGALVDPSEAVAPPAYLNSSGQASGSATGSASTSAAAGASSTPAAASSAAPTSKTTAAASSMTTARTSSARSSGTASGSSTAAAAAASGSTNGAMGGAVPGVMVVVGAVLAAAGML